MHIDTERTWLCIPFVCLCCIDAGLTLWGQSPEYWGGNRAAASECFPAFAWCLANGPSLFLLACLGWTVVFCAGVLLLPCFLADVLALALFMGHTWGAMTWLVYRAHLNYHLCLLFVLGVSSVFVFCHRRWRGNQQLCTGQT